jgi:methylmalonyl-CoA mutase
MPNTEKPTQVRFITAASLFDGHDAAINIMRRVLQSNGAEVIHLGHNRSVEEIVTAAIQEDAQAIAISSYQGGHVEFFKYMVDRLKEKKCTHIKIFGGGGGTITPAEIKEIQKYGVERIYSPEDGQKMGLEGMILDMIKRAEYNPLERVTKEHFKLKDEKDIAASLTAVESLELSKKKFKKEWDPFFEKLQKETDSIVVGLTGTGGAGKSSLTDEIVLRLLEKEKEIKIAILAIDPTRKKTGGALLGDRLRVNSLKNERVFMRSLATRENNSSISSATRNCIQLFKAAGFDWIFVETGGIGQADTSITDLVSVNLYVMTSEFGAPTQLEKINMLDFADIVAINKFEKTGAIDALLDVRKQIKRNRSEAKQANLNQLPVFGTMASRFADEGVNFLFEHLLKISRDKNKFQILEKPYEPKNPEKFTLIPKDKIHYLANIASCVRQYKKETFEQAKIARHLQSFEECKIDLGKDTPVLKPEVAEQISEFKTLREAYQKETFVYKVRDQSISVPLNTKSLSHQDIKKVAVPTFTSNEEIVKFTRLENLPGYFPFTAGVFPFKRTEEDPKRQFAGEGPPEKTNKRFHLLCVGEKAKRLSTAFDSVTLYGEDPQKRPDIYGKIGESGVSICTLDDMKKLYDGFDLCDPLTSVSMTINGPAPMMLAFFFNTAIAQQIEKFEKEKKRKPNEKEIEAITKFTLKSVRGTVQADILKEDQAQNTCIFSTEFAIRMMGDIQEYFIKNEIRNYYSVSISGYHIAEAGANPITQLALTLANGFTYAEYYLSRGMSIDDFAPNFSFFFSNGLDPEYTVIGRVARRIWAITMKNLYQAKERSQKLKYHIQTSGRSLHAQEIGFNDIRTTLQALLAYFDHCNSLHTNAYDEAVTTPTAESVRRAMAIQLIISKEFGIAKCENPWQGSFIVDELTNLVEEAVLAEFEKISMRGGVLGAMETHYQRSKIQEESLYYETLKHTGELPIVGINTFLDSQKKESEEVKEITRSSYKEKDSQVSNCQKYQQKHTKESKQALSDLKETAKKGGNIFESLMKAAKVCSLGQMSNALYQVGGEYRRRN